MKTIIPHINKGINRPFPQSFLIQKPYWGALCVFIVSFVFVIIYHPLGVHKSSILDFKLSMMAYCGIISLFELLTSIIISKTNCFNSNDNWKISSELLTILLILTTIGISSYFAGFIMEEASVRWNFTTFIDSFLKAVFIGLIPIALPSLLNIRYAFAKETFQNYEVRKTNENTDILINIESKAKKEHLSFYSDEFIYAESKGNYVVFHLLKQNKPMNVTIRNSISEIEVQLSTIPYLMRTHRAFIVNLHKITSRKGNALGYDLTLSECKSLIPVSRQNARIFEELMG